MIDISGGCGSSSFDDGDNKAFGSVFITEIDVTVGVVTVEDVILVVGFRVNGDGDSGRSSNFDVVDGAGVGGCVYTEVAVNPAA
jgi:hypothetical protein